MGFWWSSVWSTWLYRRKRRNPSVRAHHFGNLQVTSTWYSIIWVTKAYEDGFRISIDINHRSITSGRSVSLEPAEMWAK